VAGRDRVIPRVRARATQMRDVLAWRDVQLMVGLFCAAQLLDGVTTYIALSSGHFQEANPLFGGILDSYPLAAFVVKLLVAAVVVGAILAIRIRWRMRLAVMTLFTIASLAAPIVNLSRLA
jgi:hypothetical protein